MEQVRAAVLQNRSSNPYVMPGADSFHMCGGRSREPQTTHFSRTRDRTSLQAALDPEKTPPAFPLSPTQQTNILTLKYTDDGGDVFCLYSREDAEAPKAKLVKPNSLSSSRSGSSRSGASSTQSMVHSSIPRGPKPRPPPPVSATLKENGQPATFPQAPPAYTQVNPPKPSPTQNSPKPSPSKLSPANLARMGATPVMIPAQTKAFQTV
ncbi:hypothetical protein NFI96_002063 [Prochilodus magdalenae]|nr:hypothetical protein NFI96_002063 [Prochilodus magdalenae]